MSLTVCHPGKCGDLVMAMAVVRELSKALGPALVVTSSYCAPVAPLLESLPYVRQVAVVPESEYQAEHHHFGTQPWQMPIPGRRVPGEHVFQLGFRHFPRGGQTVVELAGEPYSLVPPQGPWLPLVKMDKRGPVAVPAATIPGAAWMLEHLKREGRPIRLIGTEAEIDRVYDVGEAAWHEVEEVWDFRDIHRALDGCSMFCGVNSGPSIVAQGAGLPLRWPHRPEVEQERWAWYGTDVTTIDEAGVVRRLRAP